MLTRAESFRERNLLTPASFARPAVMMAPPRRADSVMAQFDLPAIDGGRIDLTADQTWANTIDTVAAPSSPRRSPVSYRPSGPERRLP